MTEREDGCLKPGPLTAEMVPLLTPGMSALEVVDEGVCTGLTNGEIVTFEGWCMTGYGGECIVQHTKNAFGHLARRFAYVGDRVVTPSSEGGCGSLPASPSVPSEQAAGAVLSGPTLEAIAHNLCSLHDFDPAFVAGQKRFALAVIAEYLRAETAPDFALDSAGQITAAAEQAETPVVGWQDISTAPNGCVTENAGCRGESEWFLGRVSPAFRDGQPPFIVIRRRAWPQEDCWRCAGEATYRPDYFDGWQPLPTPPEAKS